MKKLISSTRQQRPFVTKPLRESFLGQNSASEMLKCMAYFIFYGKIKIGLIRVFNPMTHPNCANKNKQEKQKFLTNLFLGPLFLMLEGEMDVCISKQSIKKY